MNLGFLFPRRACAAISVAQTERTELKARPRRRAYRPSARNASTAERGFPGGRRAARRAAVVNSSDLAQPDEDQRPDEARAGPYRRACAKIGVYWPIGFALLNSPIRSVAFRPVPVNTSTLVSSG